MNKRTLALSAVAGFHDIIICKDGFKLQDLLDLGGGVYPTFPGNAAFVFEPNPANPLPAQVAPLVYYRGINPAGGPLVTAVAGNPANGSNRNEPVAFLEPGRYLVICNVRGHLVDGMYAYVHVSN